jgi:hypothetical protein
MGTSRTNHSGQGVDDSSTTSQQHSCDKDVGHDAEDSENQMGSSSETSFDDFKEGMGIGCPSLQLDSDTCEKQDLHSSSGSIPERSTDTVVVSYGGGLQQSCSPLFKNHIVSFCGFW